MPFLELPPHPTLRPYVDRFWVSHGYASDAAEPTLTPVLPDACIDILVHLHRCRAEVVGTMTQPVLTPQSQATCIAAVRFKPGAASALLGVPAHELTDRSVPLAQLDTRLLELSQLDGHTPLQAVRAIERALLQRITRCDALSPIAAFALRRFTQEPRLAADALARELGFSRQYVRKLLLREVGLSTKDLARVIRMQRTVVALQHMPARPLAQLALAHGYFDQAHMARDLHLLTGATPARVRAARGSIFPIRSLYGALDSAHEEAHAQPDRG